MQYPLQFQGFASQLDTGETLNLPTVIVSTAQYTGLNIKNASYGIASIAGYSSTNDVAVLSLNAAGVAQVQLSAGSGYAASFINTGLTVTSGLVADVIVVGTSSGPSITTGSGAPTGSPTQGSIYLRTGGGIGSTLYVAQSGGAWHAVSGV